MKDYAILYFCNQFMAREVSEEKLLAKLNSGWKIENSCYADFHTIVYILSKEE